MSRGVDGADGVDLEGKVFVVTGANSGIGKELATYVAAKGAKLYMLCRSKDKAEAAKEEIVKATSNDQVHIVLVNYYINLLHKFELNGIINNTKINISLSFFSIG